MSMIRAEHLTFSYPESYDNIFEDACFQIDTDWKLGFVGRNGRGKTTLLYGDNVFEKRGIRRDRTGGSGKGRYLQGKTGILKRDGPASASVSLKMFEREGVDVVGVLFSRLEPLRARRSRAPRRARCDIGKPPKA